ncbi:heavy-metal-associated domain-containing protein, partial [Actinomadura sp. 7K507]|uniref:heavy-metal-associated domain-containing protein n=1 Tax=Actinomadura sp. 7K507 TaxID=2530365 RepID=UPI0010433919
MAIPGASLARTALNAPVAAAAAASTLAVRGAKAGLRDVPAPKAVNEGVQRVSRAAGALAALAGGGPERHVWAHRGRAHIQASGLSGGGQPHRRYVKALTGALERLDGVNWAEVNAVTGHVLVGYEEQDMTLADLIAAIEDVEDEHQAGSFDEDAHARWPDDDMAWAAAASVLAADCAAVVAAVTGRLLVLPPLPTPVRAAVSVTDAAPHLRAAVEHVLGRTRADALLGLAGAAVNGAGQGVPPLAADAVHRVFKLYEIGARREAWRRREPELAVAGRQPQECGTPAERPCPLPDGPAEKAANRTELGNLLGVSAVLAGARDPARAGDLPLATVPKAARYGREAFAAVLAHDLAGRGAVVLQPAALRRLDRIDAVVIDSAALCAREPRLLSAAATGGDPGDPGDHNDPDDAAVWRMAAESLEGRDWDDLAGPGPWPAAPPGGG